MVRKVYLGQHFELKKSHQITQDMKNRKAAEAEAAPRTSEADAAQKPADAAAPDGGTEADAGAETGTPKNE